MVDKTSYLIKTRRVSLNLALLLHILGYFFRGLPFGFLFLILVELFIDRPDVNKIILHIISMFVIMLLCLATTALAQTRLYVTSYLLSHDLRLKLGEKLRKLSLGFFKRQEYGDIAAPLLRNMTNFEDILNTSRPNIIASIVFPATTAVFLASVNLKLTVLALAFVVVSFPVLLLSMRTVATFGNKVISLRTVTGSRIMEYFNGMKQIKSHNLTGTRFSRLELSLKQLRRESIRLEAFVGPAIYSYMLVLEIGFITTLLAGTSLLFSKDITGPMLLIFLVIGSRLFELLQGMGTFVVLMRFMNVAVAAISRIMRAKPLPSVKHQRSIKGFDIEFDSVSFGYDETEVLKKVSFKADEKKLTALVGPSGSGKTTITSLVARFWDVNSGSVRLGGNNIKEYEIEELLSCISMIFQDVYLFNDSIYNNIKIGNTSASREEIIAAAKSAHCHEFISKLPDGYDSMVGEGGARLSGGEKQRISIARALLKDAPIILLDEATSSLDPENERLIQQAVNKLVRQKTVVVIAHRLSTISHADQILVLDNGEIKEAGKHNDLLEMNGLYNRLWVKQQEAQGWLLEKSR